MHGLRRTMLLLLRQRLRCLLSFKRRRRRTGGSGTKRGHEECAIAKMLRRREGRDVQLAAALADVVLEAPARVLGRVEEGRVDGRGHLVVRRLALLAPLRVALSIVLAKMVHGTLYFI